MLSLRLVVVAIFSCSAEGLTAVPSSKNRWDEGKDAQRFGYLKSNGCHFARPADLQWFQRRVTSRCLSRHLAPIALLLYGSWWHQKNRPVSYKDAERLYGISRATAKKLYCLICEEFGLELVAIKTGNGRDNGFVIRAMRPTQHTLPDSVSQEAVSDAQEALVCNAESTDVQSPEHLLEIIESKQESITRQQQDRLSDHRPLLRQFLANKSEATARYVEEQLLLILDRYGDAVVEKQLRDGIAKEWKSISLAMFERYNPESIVNAKGDDYESRIEQNMRIHAKSIGRSCNLWDDRREQYLAICAAVESGNQ